MVHDSKPFDTQEAANAYGESFKQGWGWGYDPSFSVYQDSTGKWACCTRRARSCD